MRSAVCGQGYSALLSCLNGCAPPPLPPSWGALPHIGRLCQMHMGGISARQCPREALNPKHVAVCSLLVIFTCIYGVQTLEKAADPGFQSRLQYLTP